MAAQIGKPTNKRSANKYGTTAGGYSGINLSIGNDNGIPPCARRLMGKYNANTIRIMTSHNNLRDDIMSFPYPF
jgi:hypothetical protein